MDKELESKLDRIASDAHIARNNIPKSRPGLYAAVFLTAMSVWTIGDNLADRFAVEDERYNKTQVQLEMLEQEYQSIRENQEEILRKLGGK